MKLTNQLREEDVLFIEQNPLIFTSTSSVSNEYRQKAYDISNYIFNENKKPTSCGRCWYNLKQNLWSSYLLYKNNK